jgi:hypothetical protein
MAIITKYLLIFNIIIKIIIFLIAKCLEIKIIYLTSDWQLYLSSSIAYYLVILI